MDVDEDKKQVSEGLSTTSKNFETILIFHEYGSKKRGDLFTLLHKLRYQQNEERQHWKLEKDSELRIEIAENSKGVNLVVRVA